MGEIAEMLLEGDLCEQCGEFVDEAGGEGFPRLCHSCEAENRRSEKKGKKK